MIFYNTVRNFDAGEHVIFIMNSRTGMCIGQLVLDDQIVSEESEISVADIFEQMYTIICKEYEDEHPED